MAQGNKLTATFVHETSTKGAHRYQEVDDKGQPLEMSEAKIGTLYIRKLQMPTAAQKLTVTITPSS